MTLHQAKGLEFPAVFLYKCEETSIKNFVKSKSISVNKNFGILTKVPLNNNYSTEYAEAPIIGTNNLITQKKELAEIKRLLYVGITRAKNYLFISASIEKDKSYKEDSFIGLIQKGFGINFNIDELKLKSELKFLKKLNNNYEYHTNNIEVTVPILKSIENHATVNIQKDEIKRIEKFLVNKINDFPSSEIISATKLSVYNQCPLKYHLTYDLGFVPLFSQFKFWQKEKNNLSNYDFNESEEGLIGEQEEISEISQKNLSKTKGIIIHKILQSEIHSDEINVKLNELKKTELGFDESDNSTGKLFEEIKTDLMTFYSSNEFKKLNEFKNYKNEFEIYVKENDYFLYGIIDKFIFEENKAIIVDYKTDTLNENEFNGKIKNYVIQLSFYAYVVQKLFPNINSIQLRLVFVKYPDKTFVQQINENDLSGIKSILEKMITSVRQKKYSKNPNHCRQCSFSNKFKSCVVV